LSQRLQLPVSNIGGLVRCFQPVANPVVAGGVDVLNEQGLGGNQRATVQGFLAFMVGASQLDAMASQRVVEAQRRTGDTIGTVLTELGLIAADALTQSYAVFFEMTIAERHELPLEAVYPEQLKHDFLRQMRLLPLAISDNDIVVGTTDPFNVDAIAAVGYFTDRRVDLRLLRPRDFDDALMRLYTNGATGGVEVDDPAEIRDDDVQRLKDAASEAPIIRLVNRLLTAAVDAGASDVHIEPLPDTGVVRFRLDGMLAEIERVPRDLMAGVATRIKILAKLNIAERRLPQDGRTRIAVAGRQIDVRVSTVPSQHGESIVLRLLDQSRVELSFSTLGIDGHGRLALERLIAQPHGIILVTGPTGSGKTTTLYTALKSLNSTERKVFSVEDPIEYQLPGVIQMQAKREIGLDFVHCLRAILRQDPDVIMVGEIRDTETARIAIQASLTGHLVLSTLHTNGAAASITRLLDMGVEEYLLASSLLGVIGQRLVRRLCSCAGKARSQEVAKRVLGEIGVTVDQGTCANLKEPAGCSLCRGTGYRGRTSITEALVIDDAMQSLIVRRASDVEMDRFARAAGMESLLGCGLRKALSGETSLDEVLRVARLSG
jgi:general secretion pathway protein E